MVRPWTFCENDAKDSWRIGQTLFFFMDGSLKVERLANRLGQWVNLFTKSNLLASGVDRFWPGTPTYILVSLLANTLYNWRVGYNKTSSLKAHTSRFKQGCWLKLSLHHLCSSATISGSPWQSQLQQLRFKSFNSLISSRSQYHLLRFFSSRSFPRAKLHVKRRSINILQGYSI